MNLSKNLKAWIIENQVALALLVFIGCTLLVVVLTIITYGYSEEFFENVLVEAHGMLFDILVIGTFLFWLIKKSDKRLEVKRNIKRYEEEIDDFRDWESDEAKFRIIGSIKRLNKCGISQIDLSNCYLKDAKLGSVKLEGANLTNANLEGTEFLYANLERANLEFANLKRADLGGAILREAKIGGAKLGRARLRGAILNGAILRWADLEGAILWDTNLEEADLSHTKLRGAKLKRTKLDGTILWGANLEGIRSWTVDQFCKVNTLFEARLDKRLLVKVKEICPKLLEEPEKEK